MVFYLMKSIKEDDTEVVAWTGVIWSMILEFSYVVGSEVDYKRKLRRLAVLFVRIYARLLVVVVRSFSI